MNEFARSLVNALIKSTLCVNNVADVTVGIDITNWTVDKQEKGRVTFSVWDFAGQTVFYNTHQFFLTNRSLYLLLWNIRLGFEHSGLPFWLSSIACHAPQAPVFIVGTHVDEVPSWDLPLDQLRSRFSQISDCVAVSSATGQVSDLFSSKKISGSIGIE